MRAKILVVSERLWPEGGGGELATHLILGLLQEFFDITVVTGTPSPVVYKGVKYVYTRLLSVREKQRLWISNTLLTRQSWFRNLLEEADVVYIPRFSFPIINEAKKLKKRVIVHLHDYIPISYTATVLAPAEAHLKTLVYDDLVIELTKDLVHGIGAAALYWIPRLVRYLISYADKIICVSKRQAEIVSQVAPELSKKIRVVYNPIPKLPDIAKNPENYLLFKGGLSMVKGYHYVEALAKVLPSNIKIIVTGTPNRGVHKRLRNILFIGRVQYDQLVKLHRNALAVLFTSIWEEPLPFAVTESLMLKTVPVASKVGGIPEILNGTMFEKFLFKPAEFNVFIDKVLNVLSLGKDELIDLSEKARTHALRTINPSKIKKELLEIFYEPIS